MRTKSPHEDVGNRKDGRLGSIAATTTTTLPVVVAVLATVVATTRLEGLGFGGPPPVVFVAALLLSPSSPPSPRHLLLHRRTAATTATSGLRRRRASTRIEYKNVPGDEDDEKRGGGSDDCDPFRSKYDALNDAYDDEALRFFSSSSSSSSSSLSYESFAGKEKRVDVRVDVGVDIDGGVLYCDDQMGGGVDPPPPEDVDVDVDVAAPIVTVDSSDIGLASVANEAAAADVDRDGGGGGGGGGGGLIHELEDDQRADDDRGARTKREDAKKGRPAAAAIKAVVEPTKDKPAKKFVSPIQLMRRIPKVVPLSMSTVFFLRLVGEWPPASSAGGGRTKNAGGKRGGSDDRRARSRKQPPPPTPAEEGEKGTTPEKVEATKETKKPTEKKTTVVVESWKTRLANRIKKTTTAFRTSNYLESLGAGSSAPSSSSSSSSTSSDGAAEGDRPENDDRDTNKEDDDEALLRSLKNQRDQIVDSRNEAMRNAMIDATRRTSPEDVIARRNEKAQQEREGEESAMLERAYAERRERLDAKRRRAEDRRRAARSTTSGGKEKREEEGRREGTGREEGGELASGRVDEKKRGGGRTIPVLDVLLGRSRPLVAAVGAPPLLVGGALTMPYADLTPCQRRAVDAATSDREARRGKMIVDDDDCASPEELRNEEAGVPRSDAKAAPLIAIIDGYTASAAPPPSLSRREATAVGGDSRSRRRYATLASVEIVENDDDGGRGGGPTTVVVRLVGVGRAFLHDYVLSSETRGGTTTTMEEQEELSDILTKVREFDDEGKRDEEYDTAADLDPDIYPGRRLPVIMAEYDVFLDDPPVLADRSHPNDGQDASGNGESSAITELYRVANRAYRLHEGRKSLVAGLRAGAARLRYGIRRMTTVDLDRCVEFEDWDGLDLAGRASEVDVVAEKHSGRAPPTDGAPQTATLSKGVGNDVPIGRELEAMENYGLGSYGILSTIPDLARQLMSQLGPYYDTVHRERGEYEAEVASMAVLRTLEEYATPAELAAGLLAPSATSRLDLGFEVMMRHKEKLNELVRIISEELMDCSEECTDQW